jgi:RNA polymerase sigma-70 factor (ECF subfamily)
MTMVDSPDDKNKAKALYLKYHKLMRYVSSRILKNPMDVDDALMTAWERILSNLEKISDISCPETKSFLVIVIERVSIDIYRKNKSTWEKETPIENYEESPFFATSSKEIENIEIRDAINRIPKVYAEAILLYYLNGMSMKEISKLLGISEDAVSKRVQRGRALLKESLEGGDGHDR